MSHSSPLKQLLAALLAGAVVTVIGGAARASDHLDTPTVQMNPRADIGDIYAWTSPDAKQLNLVMTIVGDAFSDEVEYTFHVDSGKSVGATTASTAIVCRFSAKQVADCRADGIDRSRLRVFAGRRDDPFFNNVKGTRAAYQRAAAALRDGALVDAAGCPSFDAATTQAILFEWRHTNGGAASDLLAGWSPASLVVSIDVERVATSGSLLGVWATTASKYGQLDRMGRPLTGNALLGTLATDAVSDKLKEDYNRATPSTAARFVPEIEKSLGLYDGFDGKCGNQLLASKTTTGAGRYHQLATLLADDRLWINSASGACTQLFAVEVAQLTGRSELKNDCGGRAPTYSAANMYRSFLANGTSQGIDDGLTRDAHEHSDTKFPFLAAPEADKSY
ncbi:MAG TPA: DUF4331 family protein [Steroidobacteraceae bacterium]|jgi:hypothetical protein